MHKSTLKILIASAAIVAGLGAAQANERGPFGKGLSFEALDADGSGEITVEDISELRAERFASIDTDGDGSVTEEEFVAHAAARAGDRAAQMFGRLDADGDGVLSRDAIESRMGQGPSNRMLTRFDADDSGGINAEEFEVAKERLARRMENRGEGHRGGKWRRGDN